KMITLLRQWGDTTFDESDATRTEPVVRHFFAFLSRPPWVDRLSADVHPYHAFVLRLPEASIAVSDPDEEVAVRGGLRELLEHMGERIRADRAIGLEELLDDVDRAMTYEEWWQSSGRWRRYRRPDARPGEELSDFVDRFRRPEPEVAAAAEKMV